ncbi:MAG: VCBS repeat-containing protein, partial [Opitutaceae bacterium]|nr:VCBS repeat-containing protein [Opitutaceae bacterium]
RNLGDWRFEDITERAGVGDSGAAAKIWKQGATFADVNNDGHLDLYLCRFNAPNRLYLNRGDGTFAEGAQPAGLAVKDASMMAVFGDYDRDGWLDLFLQTNVLDATAGPEGQRDFLFHNNGDGTFSDVSARAGVAPGPTHGNSALWWDYDHDGWPDLYVANDFAIPDALYRNNHDGTFTDIAATAMPRVPYSSMGSDLGDADGDGRLDLLVADMAATTHEKDQRTMAETRARLRPPPERSGAVRQFPFSSLALSTGTGRSLEAAHLAGLAATDWTWSPRWEDYDNDGRVDLHVTNGMYREIHNFDLIDRRMAAGSPSAAGQVTRGSPVLAETNLVFRNLGDLRFADVSTEWGLGHPGVSFGSATGDLDGDGDLDLLYTNYQAGATLLRNDSDSGHRLVCALRGTRSNRSGVGAMITVESAAGKQVRVVMLARGFMSSSEPIAHFGLGDDTIVRRLTIAWPSGRLQVLENIAADHRLTITEPEVSEAHAAKEAPPTSPARFEEGSAALGLAWSAPEDPYDEFLDQRLLPITFNRCGPALAVGRLDTRGHRVLALGGTTLQARRVFVAQENHTWTPLDVPEFAAPPVINDGPLLFFDADGDGCDDLLVTAGGVTEAADAPEYQPRLYRGDGHGGFSAAPDDTLPPLALNVGAACAADFDRDGRLDLFLGGRVVPGRFPETPRSALLLNRGGTFEDVTATVAHPDLLSSVGMVTAALWSDVDGDTWPDLLVALDWGGVRYWHNRDGKALEDWSERAGFAAAGTGWWRSLATADLNGDGRPDFAVGNLGLNTPYRADPAHPALLFSGDFTGRGSDEIVEAYYEGERLFPRRSRSDLAAALSTLMRRFRTNNDFARATLEEIVGADRLAAATRLAATELRSGTFLSQGDGTYRFAPWPRLAQIAPASGLAASDFDGDGRADLVVVHNSHAPAPAIGAFDGGLGVLMLGDGRGGFSLVPAAESGLVVPGDARGVVVLDVDDNGRPDLVVSRSGASTLVIRDRSAASPR